MTRDWQPVIIRFELAKSEIAKWKKVAQLRRRLGGAWKNATWRECFAASAELGAEGDVDDLISDLEFQIKGD